MGVFHFKQFDIDDCACGMKICSDSVAFGAWFLSDIDADTPTVLDVGTGSGLLALLAAHYLPEAHITGVEVDSAAARAAAANFAASPWALRLKAVECDFGKYTPSMPFHAIISNPPFFTTGALAADGARAAARHEDSLTASTIMAFARAHLAPAGHLGIILPYDRTDDTIYKAEISGLKLRRLCTLIPREGKTPIRSFFDFSTVDGEITTGTLTIRDSDGAYTRQYKALVENLYTKL